VIRPLKAEKFLRAALEYMRPWKGSYIYDAKVRDYMEKTEAIDAGYGRWMNRLLGHLSETYRLPGNRALDFGCGTGELTVRMRSLNYEAYGLDLHEGHINLARILAAENGVPSTAFILSTEAPGIGGKLPFEDNSFDIVMLLSVLEHMSDAALSAALPEIHRICRGVVYVLVPNRLKTVDDHTDLKGVCWMPRWLAAAYVKMRGGRYRYHISADGSWDVYYRTCGRIVNLARRHGFRVDWPPDELVFPPLNVAPPVTRLGKHFKVAGKTIFVGLPLPCNTMIRQGRPKQTFFAYLNMILVPEPRRDHA
jgi:2-polyprenyl-3-methyl-5-hydroxy-6-metoxy-1,4-benzoquinol methylase